MKRTAFLLVLIMLFTFSTAYAGEWVCPNCGKLNNTNYCTSCGTKHQVWICPACNTENDDAFCGNCGAQKPIDLSALYGVWEAKADDGTGYLVFREDGSAFAIYLTGRINKVSFTATEKQITILSGSYEDTNEYHIENDCLYIADNNTSLTRAEISPDDLLSTMPETEAGDLLFGTVTGFSWKRTINKETLSADNHQPEWPSVPVSENDGETRRMEQYSFTITKGFSEATAVYTTTLEAWTTLKEGETVYFVQTPESNTWLIDQSGNPIAPVFRIQ